MTMLEDFARTHGLTLEVHERENPIAERYRYYCAFRCAEVRYEGLLLSAYGDGATPEAAKAGYCSEIAGEKIVLHAHEPELRREILVPADLVVTAPVPKMTPETFVSSRTVAEVASVLDGLARRDERDLLALQIEMAALALEILARKAADRDALARELQATRTALVKERALRRWLMDF